MTDRASEREIEAIVGDLQDAIAEIRRLRSLVGKDDDGHCAACGQPDPGVMWVCFHCGMEFTEDDYEAAEAHFGERPKEFDDPACLRSLLVGERVEGWAEPFSASHATGFYFDSVRENIGEPGFRPAVLIIKPEQGRER